MEAKREQNNIFTVFEEKKTQSRIPHPTNIAFKNEGEIDIFR